MGKIYVGFVCKIWGSVGLPVLVAFDLSCGDVIERSSPPMAGSGIQYRMWLAPSVSPSSVAHSCRIGGRHGLTARGGNCMISSFYGREVPTWHPLRPFEATLLLYSSMRCLLFPAGKKSFKDPRRRWHLINASLFTRFCLPPSSSPGRRFESWKRICDFGHFLDL